MVHPMPSEGKDPHDLPVTNFIIRKRHEFLLFSLWNSSFIKVCHQGLVLGGLISFLSLERYPFVWALSQLEIRSMICYLDLNVRPPCKENLLWWSKQPRIEEQFFYLALGARTIPLPYQIICLIWKDLFRYCHTLGSVSPTKRNRRTSLGVPH